MRDIALTFFIVMGLVGMPSLAKGEIDIIADGKRVKFHYTLTVRGEVIDTSEGKEPLDYVHGEKMIIAGLERELLGLKEGDQKEILIPPEQGYGPVQQGMFLEIDKDQLEEDIVPKKGMSLQMSTEEGETFSARVVEVKDTALVLDFNHPLAGEELVFNVQVVEVQ